MPDIDIQLAGLIEVKASGLRLGYQSGNPNDIFTIQGRVQIPALYGVDADFADPNYIQISTGGDVQVKGSVSINEPIVIVPGAWELDNAKLTIDTVAGAVKAAAT